MTTKTPLILASGLTLLCACGGGGGGSSNNASNNVPASVVAVTDDGRLITFEPGSPQTIRSATAIKSLPAAESIVGIDVRPSTGDLLVASRERLYRVDAASGVVTPVGAASFQTPFGAASVALQSDPVADDVRIVTDSDLSLHFSADAGFTSGQDGNVHYANGDVAAGSDPRIVAIAFTDDHAFADHTTLYGIDATQGTLVRIGDVDGAPTASTSGELHTIGSLGTATTGSVGFDITPEGGALLSLTPPGAAQSDFFSVDLATGAARRLGTIGVNTTVRALAWRGSAAPRVFGITDQGLLVAFHPGRPAEMLTSRVISGLPAGETLVAMDQRVLDGRTYALSDASRLYRLDTTTSSVTPVGPAVFSTPLVGANFDLDFTPLFGAGRVLSDGGQNLRINPIDGSVASVDQQLAYAAGDPQFGTAPIIVAAAYSNNVFGAQSTTLYAIDSSADTLVRIGSLGGSPDLPNGGIVTTIGPLGASIDARSGFDIDSNGVAFAALDLGQVSNLCKIDLATGAVRDIGTIGSQGHIVDMAVETLTPPMIFGVDDANQLVSFQASAPGQIVSALPISGLASGESVVAVDFDPLTRDLIGVSDQSRVFRIERTTGVATLAGPAFTPTPAGTRTSTDVDPVSGDLRVVSDAGTNLRVSAATGETIGVDANLAYAAADPHFGMGPAVVSIAHAGNGAGSSSTALLGIDAMFDTLVQQGAASGPDSGELTTIGPLGVDVAGDVGFDVDAHGMALASNGAVLYRVDLAAGTLTSLGSIGGHLVRDFAIQPR